MRRPAAIVLRLTRKLRKGPAGAVLVGFLLGILTVIAWAQPAISGKISGGFQAPTSTDGDGRRHVLKGQDATPSGTNVYELTEPRVTSFTSEDNADMFIESPRCFYDMKQRLAWSGESLSVRTADERFSIVGTGWRWEPSAADLTISNQVVALVQRASLATPPPEEPPTPAVPGSPTNDSRIRVTASSLRYRGDQASFMGQVQVKDRLNSLDCEQLNLAFLRPGGIETIEALRNVVLRQEGAVVRSGHAHYHLTQNILRMTEQPRWVMENQEGSAERLVLDRSNRTTLAEGQVFMRMPLTNLAGQNPASSRTNEVATNRFIEIHAGKFFHQQGNSNEPSRAVYEKEVQVRHPQALIRSARLTVDFDRTNRLSAITAEQEVEIESGDNRARADRGFYDLLGEKITLSGSPQWMIGDKRGRSRTLIFHPKTREVFALEAVEMIVPGASLGGKFAAPSGTVAGAAPANQEMRITATTFSHGGNVAVFHEKVLAADAHGALGCELLTIFTGASNQVQRMVAEDGVRLEQKGMVATGRRAEYDLETGLVELKGNPEMISAGRSLRADGFVIDRQRNTFAVTPGPYRIDLQLPAREKRPGGNPGR